MMENEQPTEKKELVELFCSRIDLEQKRYKKRMMKMSPEAVFGKAYEINCMLSIYETLLDKAEKMEADVKTGDSFQQELENSMENGMKEIKAILNKPERKAA